jgi:1,4-alpha-glucan branching enzyme
MPASLSNLLSQKNFISEQIRLATGRPVRFLTAPSGTAWAVVRVKFADMLLEMHASSRTPLGVRQKYSAKNMAKPINFFCVAPQARSVCLVGDFNDWQPGAHPMARQPDGSWHVVVPIHHGHHRYQFLVDGKPTLDPRATGLARNEKNERVSLMAVS